MKIIGIVRQRYEYACPLYVCVVRATISCPCVCVRVFNYVCKRACSMCLACVPCVLCVLSELDYVYMCLQVDAYKNVRKLACDCIRNVKAPPPSCNK